MVTVEAPSETPPAVAVRRLRLGVAAAGVTSFALLYAPQAVLPQLAASYRLDPGSASLAISVATGALGVAVLPLALLSERIGRHRIIVASVAATVVLGLLVPFAPNYPVFLALRALQGLAIAGFPAVGSAYLVERLGKAGVAGAVGAMIAGNAVGGMLGRMLAGLTTDWLGWHAAIATVSVVSAFTGALALWLLPHPWAEGRLHPTGGGEGRLHPTGGGEGRLHPTGRGQGVLQPMLVAQYLVGMLGVGAFVAVYNAGTFRLTGEPFHLSAMVTSLVFVSYAVGGGASAAVGPLVRRFGRLRVQLGLLLAAMAGAVLTLSGSLAVVVLGFLVFTGGFFGAHAVANGWAAARAPVPARGLVSGVYTLAFYVGAGAGGQLGAMIFGHAGWPVLIVTCVGWLVLAAAAVLVVSARDRRDQQPAADR